MRAALSLEPALYSRPKRRRAQPERSLQQDVVWLLSRMLGGDAWFTHFPSGGGGKARGGVLKAMGLKPGVPDILILEGRAAFWIELKSQRGTVSEAQRECHAALRRAGADVVIAKNIEDVMRALKGWGVAISGHWEIPGAVEVGVRRA